MPQDISEMAEAMARPPCQRQKAIGLARLSRRSPRVSQNHAGRYNLNTPASGLLVDIDLDLRPLLLKALRKCTASLFGSPDVTLGGGNQFTIIIPEGLKPPARDRFERLTKFCAAIPKQGREFPGVLCELTGDRDRDGFFPFSRSAALVLRIHGIEQCQLCRQILSLPVRPNTLFACATKACPNKHDRARAQ
jgi:hypothetical protein